MELIIEFHRPDQLIDPKPKYENLLKKLHKDIGNEQLLSRIEEISVQWASNSGYYFFLGKEGLHFIFVHVSLNPKDFV